MVQGIPSLKGKTVVITRPKAQSKAVATKITELGGKPFFLPTIEIKAPKDRSLIKGFLEELSGGKVDFVIFMSVNGVRYLIDAAEDLGLSNKLLTGLSKSTVIAVGPKTAEELRTNNIHFDIFPSEFSSEGIVQILKKKGVSGKVIRIPRTPAASPVLLERLNSMGAFVEEIYVYESGLPTDEELTKRFLETLRIGKLQSIVFGSSLTVNNLFTMLNKQISSKELSELMNSNLTIVAIGPVTAKTLKEKGVRVDVVPDEYLFESALDALAVFWNKIS